jgi:hypothetical protein
MEKLKLWNERVFDLRAKWKKISELNRTILITLIITSSSCEQDINKGRKMKVSISGNKVIKYKN